MGFSVTVAHAIFLTAVLATASAAGSALLSLERETADTTREEWRQHDRRMASNFTIDTANYDSGALTLTLTLTNRGAAVLDLTSLEYVVDGAWRTSNVQSTSVEGNTATDLWIPGEQLTVTLTSIPAPGAQVRVIGEHGATAYW